MIESWGFVNAVQWVTLVLIGLPAFALVLDTVTHIAKLYIAHVEDQKKPKWVPQYSNILFSGWSGWGTAYVLSSYVMVVIWILVRLGILGGRSDFDIYEKNVLYWPHAVHEGDINNFYYITFYFIPLVYTTTVLSFMAVISGANFHRSKRRLEKKIEKMEQ